MDDCRIDLIAAVDVPVQLWEAAIADDQAGSTRRTRIRKGARRSSSAYVRCSVGDVPAAHDEGVRMPTSSPTRPLRVALKYDPEKGGAPMLLAKGSDFLALKIREIRYQAQHPAAGVAGWRGRSITPRSWSEIPPACTAAGAGRIQIRQYQAGKGKRPDPLRTCRSPRILAST